MHTCTHTCIHVNNFWVNIILKCCTLFSNSNKNKNFFLYIKRRVPRRINKDSKDEFRDLMNVYNKKQQATSKCTICTLYTRTQFTMTSSVSKTKWHKNRNSKIKNFKITHPHQPSKIEAIENRFK